VSSQRNFFYKRYISRNANSHTNFSLSVYIKTSQNSSISYAYFDFKKMNKNFTAAAASSTRNAVLATCKNILKGLII